LRSLFPAFFGQFVGHDSFQAARRDRRSCDQPGLGCTGRAVAVAERILTMMIADEKEIDPPTAYYNC
jgi:hypothetical protein